MSVPVRLVLLLALLPGCAYSVAMKRGDEAAAKSQWSKAHDAYEFAFDTKQTDESQEAMDAAVKGLLDEVDGALEASQFEAAFGYIDAATALDADHPEIAEKTEKAQKALLAVLPVRTDQDEDLHEAYAFAALAKRLHPRSWEIEDTIQAMRQRVIDDVKAHREAGEWREARASVAALLKHEPELGTMARGLDDGIVKDWIAELESRAAKAERSQPGMAAVLLAVAYEVGDDPEHLARARKLYKTAGEAAKRTVKLESDGAPRHWALKKRLKAAVEEMEGAAITAGTSPDLSFKVRAGQESCRESSEKEAMSKDYVKGIKQVPNPAHAELTKDKAEAEAAKADADKVLDKVSSAHASAKEKLEALEEEHDEAKKAHDAAASVLDVTQKQADESKAARDEAKERLEKFESEGQDVVIDSAKEKLESAEAVYQEWKSKLDEDSAKEEKTKKQLDEVNARLEPQKEAFEELSASLEEAEKGAEETDKELTSVAGKLEGTPETLPEDIPATHKWDKITWTYACTMSTTVTARTSWNTELEKSKKLEGKREVSDTSQRGFEKADVKADEKEYPKDKKTLVGELEEEAEAVLPGMVDAFLAEAFVVAADEALAEEKEIGAATQTLTGILSGSPSRLSAEKRKAAVEWITSQHGLSDYGLLDKRATAPEKKADDSEEKAEETEEKAEEAEGKAEEAEGKTEEAEETEEKAEEKAEETDAGSIWQ